MDGHPDEIYPGGNRTIGPNPAERSIWRVQTAPLINNTTDMKKANPRRGAIKWRVHNIRSQPIHSTIKNRIESPTLKGRRKRIDHSQHIIRKNAILSGLRLGAWRHTTLKRISAKEKEQWTLIVTERSCCGATARTVRASRNLYSITRRLKPMTLPSNIQGTSCTTDNIRRRRKRANPLQQPRPFVNTTKATNV